MVKGIILIVVSILLVGCSDKTKEDELYELLLVCFDDYYLFKKISASDTLRAFEDYLISEGHLQNNSGESYLELLDYLKNNTYFKLPLKKVDFSNALLYSNPNDLLFYAHDNFNIDSSEFLTLDYYNCADQISQMFEANESIDIHQMFDIYAKYLDKNEIVKPFVRESMLHFFYRWYFTSKYNRDIPIPKEELKTEELLEPVVQDQVEIP